MPLKSETCIVYANGQYYDIWETVEVHRSAIDIIDHAMLTVSELSTGGTKLSQLKLAPGDSATVELGGVRALTGNVYLRQAAYDAKTHAVQIGIASKTQAVMRTTVDANPGQYVNQTLQQIGSAVFGKVGVGFTIVGNPPDADLPFERESETVGSTRYSFVENLCRLRNLHMIDDGSGNIIAYRGAQGSTAPLREGFNILKARLLLKADEYVEDLTGVAQVFNKGTAGAQITANTTVANPVGSNAGGNFKFPAENAADQPSLQMRVNHQADYVNFQTVDGAVTVQGWFLTDGDLWMNHVPDDVRVYSPMLMPGDGYGLFIIKEVIHRQSSAEGTTTDILITNPNGLGRERLSDGELENRFIQGQPTDI
jgi:prophage tail gpP-like protein